MNDMPCPGTVEYGNVEAFHKINQHQVGMGLDDSYRKFLGKHWCYSFLGIERDRGLWWSILGRTFLIRLYYTHKFNTHIALVLFWNLLHLRAQAACERSDLALISLFFIKYFFHHVQKLLGLPLLVGFSPPVLVSGQGWL